MAFNPFDYKLEDWLRAEVENVLQKVCRVYNAEGQIEEEIIEELSDAFEQDYEQVEREDIVLENAGSNERAVEFRFYYLDLLVISRAVILHIDESMYLIQMQAESRDFDANEMVFSAILKQLRR